MTHPFRLRACPWLLAAGLLAALVFNAPAATAADRPNILWITVEDMSTALAFGDGTVPTPAIDSLARDGVRYTNAFATAPVCSPARACLITGVYATQMGNGPLRCRMPIPASFRGYAALLREAGYFTSNNVKTDYNIAGEAAFIKDCWDRCDARAHWRQRKPGQPFMSVFNLMQTHQSRINVDSWESFEKLAKAELAPEERTDPAKVKVPPYYPDTPTVRRTLARTQDCIRVADKHVGRILKELEDDGLAEETIVFFYGDNGTGLPRGKRTLYDSGLRVPLILRFPKNYRDLAPAAPGATAPPVARLVSFVDFAPTVLSLAGVKAPGHMQGTPFLGAAAGPARTLAFGARERVDEAYDLSRSVSDGRWLYIRNYMPHVSHLQPEGYSDQADLRRELRSLADAGRLDPVQRAWAGPGKPREELYDCQADPHNVNNLAGRPEHADRLHKMAAALREWLVSIKDVNFVPEEQLLNGPGRGRPPYEAARDGKGYGLEDVLAAAELVGRPEALGRQIELLTDANPATRYWGAVGLRAAVVLRGAAMPAEERGRIAGTLEGALKDAAPAVRVEAAGTLLLLDGQPDAPAAGAPVRTAMEVLTTALKGDNFEAALHAARTLQLLGPRARPALADMRAALAAAASSSRPDHALYFRFALGPAIRALDRPRP